MCKQSGKILNNKISDHVRCGHSMSTIWEFYNIKNKHTLYRGKNCMKKFCSSLRNIINFERKIMLLLVCYKSMLELWKKNFTKSR